MQTAPPPHSWPIIYFLLGTLIGLIPQLVSSYRNRKKSDDGEAEARANLAEASACSPQIRDDIATGEGVGKMLSALIEAGDTIKELQDKVFRLEQDNVELEIARYDIRKLKGLLDAHSISYSEADRPQK